MRKMQGRKLPKRPFEQKAEEGSSTLAQRQAHSKARQVSTEYERLAKQQILAELQAAAPYHSEHDESRSNKIS
jgi:hypothetical protein